LRVFIDNLSPLVARDVAVTIVYPDANGELLEVPDSLRSRVEKHTNSRFPRISVSPGKLVDAYHDALGDRGVVLPFEKRRLSWKFELLQGVWKAAVVCTSATSLPRYWQISAWIYSAERIIDFRFERHDDDQPVIVGLSGI